MPVEPKTRSGGESATPAARKRQTLVVATGFRRCFVWFQIILVFAFLELALWAPTRSIRNRWAMIAAITMLVVVLIEALIDRRSLPRLGLALPKLSNATVVLSGGLAAALFLIILVSSLGGQIPANPTWFPNLPSV